MRIEALNHELCVDLVLEPVVAFHSLEQAVRHAVAQYELHILVLEVVLKEVIVLVWRLKAVMVVRTDVEKERQVELVVVDLWVSCEPPVDVEVASFVELGDGHRQHVDLVVQCHFRQIVQVLVDDARAKQVVSVLQDVLAQVEDLPVAELSPRALMVQLRMSNAHLEIVQVRVNVTGCCCAQLRGNDG